MIGFVTKIVKSSFSNLYGGIYKSLWVTLGMYVNIRLGCVVICGFDYDNPSSTVTL